MNKEELLKLADSFQSKADTALQNYQETGMSRYGSTYRRNEHIADALRMVAGAAEEHQAYINLRMELSNFASRARLITFTTDERESSELAESLIRDIVASGHLHGLVVSD